MEEKNRLIQEFEGYKIVCFNPDDEDQWYFYHFVKYDKNGNEIGRISNVDEMVNISSQDTLPYNSDWNYLMSAVQTIESLGYCISITTNVITIGLNKMDALLRHENIISTDIDGGTKFDSLYDSVIKFIEYYNNK